MDQTVQLECKIKVPETGKACRILMHRPKDVDIFAVWLRSYNKDDQQPCSTMNSWALLAC